MSQRRKIGDRVWVQKGAGFGASQGEWGYYWHMCIRLKLTTWMMKWRLSMGREVRRVPLDFDWPIGEVWPGKHLSLCSIMTDKKRYQRLKTTHSDCELCRKFADLAGLQLTTYGCPKLSTEDPPQGDGWQLWNTTTKGHPMTPVFATPEELAQYCADENISSFGYQTESYDTWLKFIAGPGWALTGVCENGEIKSGVKASVEKERK